MEKETTPNKKSPPRGSASASAGKKPRDAGKMSKPSTGAVESVKGKATKSVPAKMNSGASVTSKAQTTDVGTKPQAAATTASPSPQAGEVKSSAAASTPRTPTSTASARSPEIKANESTRSISAEERYRLIAEAAYYRAEKRGFQGGDPNQDWIQAEKEVDAKLSKPD
mgnify:CR=1 FL=1